jgi:hypothetical protein
VEALKVAAVGFAVKESDIMEGMLGILASLLAWAGLARANSFALLINGLASKNVPQTVPYLSSWHHRSGCQSGKGSEDIEVLHGEEEE